MSIPSSNIPSNSIFNRQFSKFCCSNEQTSLVKDLLEKFVAYPSTYVWERIGIGAIYHIGRASYTLKGTPLNKFNESLLPKIQKIFQRGISLLFPKNEREKEISLENWEKEKDVLSELRALAKTLPEESKETLIKLFQCCELFFVYEGQKRTKVKATHLLATRKIEDITNNYIPAHGSRKELFEAIQTILSFQTWVLPEDSPHYSALLQCKNLLAKHKSPKTDLKPVVDLLRHIQKGASLKRDDLFTLFFRELVTAAGLFFSRDALGSSLHRRMTRAMNLSYEYEKRKNDHSTALPTTDLAVHFLKSRRELDEKLIEDPNIVKFIELFYTQMNLFIRGRIGSNLSLFFLLTFELFQSDRFSYRDLLQSYETICCYASERKNKFHKKWKAKLKEYSKQPNRDNAEEKALQRVLQIESILESDLLTIQLQLHASILEGILLLLNEEEATSLATSSEKKLPAEQFFKDFRAFTFESISRWPKPQEKNESPSPSIPKEKANKPSLKKKREREKKKIVPVKKETPLFASLHEETMAILKRLTLTEEISEIPEVDENQETKISETIEEISPTNANSDTIRIAIPQKVREMNRFLQRSHFVPLSQRGKGSHRVFKHTESEIIVVVPTHKEIPLGTARSIVLAAERAERIQQNKGNE